MHMTNSHQDGSHVVVEVNELWLVMVVVELSVAVTEVDEEALALMLLAVLETIVSVAVIEVDDEALAVVVIAVGEVVVAEMMVAVGLVSVP
mmetsp:Transcript_32964/g.94201  ORF Transcript_32964/g.94201 Transcript_32964/m.94201 type:complete len:91 (+) Transcript_32964:657-929(+)